MIARWFQIGTAVICVITCCNVGRGLAAGTPDNPHVLDARRQRPSLHSVDHQLIHPNAFVDQHEYDEFIDPDDAVPTWRWTTGVEATLLFADFDTIEAPANVTSTSLANPDNMYAGPRLWLGLQRDNWTLLGRYWQLNGSENFFDPTFEPGLAQLTSGVFVEQRAFAYAADLEALRAWSFTDGLSQYVSFGSRHAALEHDSILWANQLISNDVSTGFAGAFQDFEGHGITGSWGGTYPLSYFSDHFNFYWNARSSILWGDMHSEVQTNASVISPAGSAIQFSSDSGDFDDELFIGEIQLGLQWNHQLACLPAAAFVRVAGEYQFWNVDADIVSAASFAENPGVSEIFATAALADLRVNLVGVTIGTGLTW